MSFFRNTYKQCRQKAALLFLCGALIPASAGSLRAQTAPDSTAQSFILKDVQIIRGEVFDTTGGDLPVAGPILNKLHIVTHEHVIAYEIFPQPGDTITRADADQIERNLRALKIFSTIALELIPLDSANADTTAPRNVRLKVTTRDAWSTALGVSYNFGGTARQYGLSVSEANFLGLAQQIVVGADYSNINDRGWRGTFSLLDPNLFGTHVQTGLLLDYSRLAYNAYGYVDKPYFADQSPHTYKFSAQYGNGREFFFTHGDKPVATGIGSRVTGIAGWYGWARQENGSVFRLTLRSRYNRADRDTLIAPFQKAFQNSVELFAGISSQKRRFTRMANVDYAGESQAAVGAGGNVVIGKISPINGGGDNIFYIGADARQAVREGPFYGFASLEAGTGLENKEAKFTLMRIGAAAVLQLPFSSLALRFDETNTWNWNRYISLPLDNLNRMRGYKVNNLIGDNRMLINMEYRAFPPINLLFFNIGAAAFYDLGAVWDQGQKLQQTRFHNSAGFGLRITNTRVPLGDGVLRLEMAYNFDERRFSPQLIFSSLVPFDLFGQIDFKAPAAYIP